MSKQLSPQSASTFHEIFSLNSDNHDTKNAWIIIDGNTVTLCKQRAGEEATEKITLLRRDFNALIGWYTKPQKISAKGQRV